jgi:hypothetical protein
MVLTELLSFAPVTDLGLAHSSVHDYNIKGVDIYSVTHLDLEFDKSYAAQWRSITPGCLYLGHSQLNGKHLNSRHHRVPLICLDKPKFKPMAPWPGQLFLINPAITAMFGHVQADRALGLRSFGVPEQWVDILAAVPKSTPLPAAALLEVVNVAQIHDFLEWVPLASAYLTQLEDDSDDDVEDDDNDDEDNDGDGDDEWHPEEEDNEVF